MLDLDQDGRLVSIISRPDSRYMFLKKTYRPHVAYNDIGEREGLSFGHGFALSGSENGKLYVRKGSCNFLLHAIEEIKRIPEILNLVDIVLFPNYIFIRYGYLHHGDAEYLGSHNLRYHLYHIPSDKLTYYDVCFCHLRSQQVSSKPEKI